MTTSKCYPNDCTEAEDCFYHQRIVGEEERVYAYHRRAIGEVCVDSGLRTDVCRRIADLGKNQHTFHIQIDPDLFMDEFYINAFIGVDAQTGEVLHLDLLNRAERDNRVYRADWMGF